MSTRNQNRTSPRVAQPRRQMGVASIVASAVPADGQRSVALREVVTGPARTSIAARASMAARTSVAARSSMANRNSVAAAARVSMAARTSVAASSSVATRTSMAARNSVAVRTAVSTSSNLPRSRVSTRRTTRGEARPMNPIVENAEVEPNNNSPKLNDSINSIRYMFSCPICMTYAKQEGRRILATSCGHVFCEVCLLEAYTRRMVCPTCQQETEVADFRELYL